MKEKGVYPYDYMDSFSRFKDTQLPKREDFYSLLTDEDIGDDDYSHAQDVWNTFQIKNMGEYHDLYLKSDILLLVDVFENFRKTRLINYKLDPCHYVTSPGLAWEANNQYMENYDPNRDSSYIMYLDANNLYGWAMYVKTFTLW